jgi:hypothetical protein
MLDRSGGNSDIGCAFAAAPPVAAARYVRAAYGDSVLITYVGDCPSGSDPAIDARFSPAGFLASLHRQGISMEDQPREAVVAEADRWRRYQSTPGGVPALRYLARPPVNRVLRDGDERSLTYALPASRSNMVVDFSIAANCVCSGAGMSIDDDEPPRSRTRIVVAPNGLDLGPAPSPPRVRPTLRSRSATDLDPQAEASQAGVAEAAVDPVPAVTRTAPRFAKPDTTPLDVPVPNSMRRRVMVLALLPVSVLATAAALGIGVYRVSSPAAPASPPSAARRAVARDSVAARTPDSSMGFAPNPGIDSARQHRDSLANRQPRRRRAIEVVPGWLPQGRPTFTPADSMTGRKP